MMKNIAKGYTWMTPTPWYFPGAVDPVTISAEQGTFFTGYVSYTEEELESGFWPANPYKIKLFIDDGIKKEEINLIRFHFYNKEDYPLFGGMIGPKTHNWFFTIGFDPGYFELGTYEVTVEYWVKKPYAGSDSNEWRPFENVEGPDWYGPHGMQWIFTYILTVE